MANQFDVIEAGERGRRRWIGLSVVLALLAIPVVGLLLSRDPEPPPPSAPQPIRSLTRIEGAPNLLHAPTTVKGGDEVIRVVFPDGARAEVRYPAELDLDGMGSRPFQGGWVDEIFRQFVAPYNEVEITRGGRPIRNYAPHVTLWPRQAGSGSQVLLFAFDDWRLAMYDRGQGLTFDQRMALARGLTGKVTEDGYLVLSAKGAVRLAGPGTIVEGSPVGPQLWFGGGAREVVALVPTPGCERITRLPSLVGGRTRSAGSVCRKGVLIVAAGSRSFRERAIDGIRVTMK
ncbi:hypothetical protein [Nonomuraea sp. NPDC002799]